MSDSNTSVFDYVYEYRGTLVSCIAIIISTVAILGSSRCQRRNREKRPECKPPPICFDCSTQTQYTFTLTFPWGNPRVVPVATWKNLCKLPEVCRFPKGSNPFYTEPIIATGAFEKVEKPKAKTDTVIPETPERTEVTEEANRTGEEEEVTPEVYFPPTSSS